MSKASEYAKKMAQVEEPMQFRTLNDEGQDDWLAMVGKDGKLVVKGGRWAPENAEGLIKWLRDNYT